MPTTIYALCEPDLQVPVIRYIGKTAKLPAVRLHEHVIQSARCKTHLGYWLTSLRIRGEKPVLMELTTVSDELGSAAERLYIKLAREGGMELVNATDGGEGGFVPASQTPEAKAKRSATRKGKKRTPCSRETRAKISASLKGVPTGLRSPEHCAALSQVKLAFHALRRLPLFTDGSGI